MLLAVDTSTSQIGLALYSEQQVLAEYCWTASGRHTTELAPAVINLLARSNKTINDIQALGIATGPGSFTSLRVGMSFVKGVSLARGIPVIGIPTLDIVAASIPPTTRKLAAVLQAGRGRLALVWYRHDETGWNAEGPPIVITAEELERSVQKPIMICGELTVEDRHHLSRRYKNIQLVSPARCIRRPGLLGEIAWEKWKSGEETPLSSLSPIYLHTSKGLTQ